MQRVHVTQEFPQPVEEVFAYLSEQENLEPLFGAKIKRLSDGSDGTRNGKGASRELRVGPLPGFVETELASDTPPEYKEALVRRTALGRLGTPEDIAEVVCFLASDAGRWVTGETISVSGGLG